MEHKWNIEFENAGLVYPNGKEALKNINLKIDEGEMIAIIGLSGAGKTTLLKTINKLQDITSGALYVGDKSKEAVDDYKSKKIKFENEAKKLKKFSDNPILNKKIIESFISDLQKTLKAKFTANKNRSNKIITLNKKIAQPYAIQIREIKMKIFKIKLKLNLKARSYDRLRNKYKKIIELCKEWDKEENQKIIVKELKKRLQKRVNFFQNEYKKSKNSPAYYSVRKLKGKKARIYKSKIGMVFQRYNLIYKSSVLNNALSGRLSKMSWWRAITGIWSKKDKDMAFKALADVNILELAYSKAEDLSGGQMQRVALARTITQNARLFLADEPVGALDPIMAKSVMDSFLEINKKTGKTVLMNLHHVDLALTYADRIIGIKEGQIVFDGASDEINFKILKKIYGNKLEGFDAHELKEIMKKRKVVKG